MSNARAYVISIEYDHEGEICLGIFGSEDYARSRLIALDSGDVQHIRLFCGSNVETHLRRRVKYRRVPLVTPGTFTSIKDGWLDWESVL